MYHLQKLLNTHSAGSAKSKVPGNHYDPAIHYLKLVKAASAAQLFLFSNELSAFTGRQPGQPQMKRMETDPYTLSLPFPVCSFEMAFASRTNFFGESTGSPQEQWICPVEPENHKEDTGMLCSILVDSNNKTMWYTLLEIAQKDVLLGNLTRLQGYMLPYEAEAAVNIASVVNIMLDVMEKERIFKKPTNGASLKVKRSKARRNKGKGKLKIPKPVVWIIGKDSDRSTGSTGTGSLTEMQWSHRWRVRGHWRVYEGGLGKDTRGVYNQSGRTWVTNHIKGPEDKLLIEKHRIVKV